MVATGQIIEVLGISVFSLYSVSVQASVDQEEVKCL